MKIEKTNNDFFGSKVKSTDNCMECGKYVNGNGWHYAQEIEGVQVTLVHCDDCNVQQAVKEQRKYYEELSLEELIIIKNRNDSDKYWIGSESYNFPFNVAMRNLLNEMIELKSGVLNENN